MLYICAGQALICALFTTKIFFLCKMLKQNTRNQRGLQRSDPKIAIYGYSLTCWKLFCALKPYNINTTLSSIDNQLHKSKLNMNSEEKTDCLNCLIQSHSLTEKKSWGHSHSYKAVSVTLRKHLWVVNYSL